jgi:maltooligosyltrehalose trehalohydrolase
MDVRLRGDLHELTHVGDGVWEAQLEAAHGDDYAFVLDGGRVLADPCSRWQPNGLEPPSCVVDPAQFRWSDDGWSGLALEDLVLYELHVGTFTREGTLDVAAARLPELADLGVTAVELMPVATFPGERGWGYDCIYAYAPHETYGGPEALARFVDAAHAAGLGVVLDVVYNHVGPGGRERLEPFGPYFTDRHETFWGPAIDYSLDGVREWAIQNALVWVRDFHVDGLRLDATHAIVDPSPRHVCAELAERVHEARPGALVTSEMQTGDLRPIEDWGHDAQWADEFHHELHVLLTRERDGYYGDYRGSVADLARQYHRKPPERLIFCSQNHDQVGNRALGDRPATHELRLRAACLLFAPHAPLLFMGEEYGERRPFQYFTDHVDRRVAEATRTGRRREFERFAAFAGEDVPDPQALETFERSRLSWDGDAELRAVYRRLLQLRRRLPREVQTAVEGDVLRVERGSAEFVADFGRLTVEIRE